MIIYYLYTNIQLARCSARPKHPHEPLVAYELQRPFLRHRHVLFHLPCYHHVAEDRTPKQATVHYYLSWESP
jgi:hypothetical protein